MTPALRKYHRVFWLMAACTMPVLFVAAIVNIPSVKTGPRIDSTLEEALPLVVRHSYSEEFEVKLRDQEDGDTLQLEVLLLKPLRTPEALVYITGSQEGLVTDGILLGKLSSGPVYRFTLQEGQLRDVYNIVIYNPFSQSAIAIIAL